MMGDLIEREAAAQAAASIGAVYASTAEKAIIGAEAIALCKSGAEVCANVVAAIRALPAATVTVKPLIWRVQSVDCQIGETPWGSAAVQNESHALAPERWGWWMVGSGEDDSPTGYETGIELAKAAAQADYDARICAALNVSPVTLAEAARVPEIAALIEAVPDLLDFIERHSNRWDGIIGKHPMEIHMAATVALRAIAGEPK